MAATLGHQADALAFLTALEQAPYKFDFYQTLRRLECMHAPTPRWGQARRPADEPVRFGQDPELSFAPAPLGAFEPPRGTRPARLQVRLFGLMGPNGPLPIHITEYARERMRHAGDPTLARFLDILQHRFIEFFYRAWAQAQPHVNHDRPDDDRFTIYVGSFIGLSQAPFRHRDSVPDLAKFHHAGVLIRHPRSAAGLQAILQHFFRVPVRLQEFVGHWMELPVRERTRLGAESASLGGGAVLGRRIWDRQHKVRIHLGPLSREQYAAFLPGGTLLRQLVDWVRLYLTFELEWDVRLLLAGGEVPSLRLGSGARLGWTTWLGRRASTGDAGDLCLNAEAFVARTTPADDAGVRGYQTP
jgi:type VI secretion system protein ImpH